MKLKYETGIATFVQFVAVSLLGLANMLHDMGYGCFKESGQCMDSVLSSVGYFILLTIVFAGIWMLGYFAQEKRSKLLALGLIGVELLVIKVAHHNATHPNNHLNLVASVVDIILAAYVIFLAIRLIRAGGGRVVSRQSQRRRRKHPTTEL